MQRLITIVGTKDVGTGTVEVEGLGEVPVVSKEELVERIEELTDEKFGYSILIAEEDGE